MIIIRYCSMTQLYLVIGPFALVMICMFLLMSSKGEVWLFEGQPQAEIAICLLSITFGWMVVGGEVMVGAYQAGRRKVGFVDISRNSSPTRLERRLMKLFGWLSLVPAVCFASYAMIHGYGSISIRESLFLFVMGLGISGLVGLALHLVLTMLVLLITGFRVRPLLDR